MDSPDMGSRGTSRDTDSLGMDNPDMVVMDSLVSDSDTDSPDTRTECTLVAVIPLPTVARTEWAAVKLSLGLRN